MGDQTRKKRTGRPPKFAEPRRPVTVTLPERTLQQLAQIHSDRAKAIALAAESKIGHVRSFPDVEQIEVMRGMRLLVVGPNKCLESIPGLQMVAIAPGRFLLAFPSGTDICSLEVSLSDLLERTADASAEDLRVVESLLKVVRSSRRDRRVSKSEILFVQG